MKVDTAALRELMHPGSTCHLISEEELLALVDAYDALVELVACEEIAEATLRADGVLRKYSEREIWKRYPLAWCAAREALA